MTKLGNEGKQMEDAQNWDAIEGSDKLSEAIGANLNRAGRKKGVQNKLTRTVKQVLEKAFNELQKHPEANLVTWATANPGAFYQIAAKLIPIESKTELTMPIEHEMSLLERASRIEYLLGVARGRRDAARANEQQCEPPAKLN